MARAGVGATALSKTLPLLPGVDRESAARECAAMGTASDSAAGNSPGIAPGNLVAVVPFGVGSAAWSVEQADAAALVRRAKGAALIMIRGRTDAAGESPQQTFLARRRAEAAAEFLQQAGVSKDKLRLTWQGAGDPVAGLGATERVQSRRVEIEFYAAAPILVSLRSGAAARRTARALRHGLIRYGPTRQRAFGDCDGQPHRRQRVRDERGHRRQQRGPDQHPGEVGRFVPLRRSLDVARTGR
jgi:hypothetical protein